MNLLEVQRKFKRLEAQEDRVRYYYNPGAKYVRGQRQHAYINELRNDAGMDKRRFGMNPYITNEEQFENIRQEEEMTAESQRASLTQTTQQHLQRISLPTGSESSLPTPAPQPAPPTQKSKKRLSQVRNTAALMKIIVKPNASQKHLTTLMGRNFSKPNKLSLNNSYSSPGFLSQSRPSRAKKLGGIYSSLRLRFALRSRAQVFALRITDVALPEKPTREVTHCAKTADGYLLVAEETVVHPSLIVPWAVDNHPCTLLWEVREQESPDEQQGQVLIRHITFMRSFEPLYVPQIFLQIMGFFAELNVSDSPFSKFYSMLITQKASVLKDFKALQKLYA